MTAEGAPVRPRGRWARRLGVVVILVALLTGGLAVTHVGPFHSLSVAASTPSTVADTSTDVRGSWNVLESYGDALDVETLDINTESLSTGAFSGTITSPVGVEIMKGSVIGTTMSFTITLGTGSDRGSATVSTTATGLRVQGTFTNPGGGGGTFLATRSSA